MECMGYDTVVVGVCTKTPISFLIFGTGCYACQKILIYISMLRFFWLRKPLTWTDT